MDRLAKLKKEIEINILKTLADLLKKGQISIQTSKEISQEYLSLLPFNSEEDMRVKFKNFTVKYPALDGVYAALMTHIEEDKTQEVIGKLRSYIHQAE